MNNDRIYYSHEAEMYAMRGRSILALLFLSFGMGIGAVIALLFAPTSGKTIRHQIADKVEDSVQTGRDSFDPIKKRVEEKLQNGRDAVEEEFDDLKKNVKEHLK